MNGRDFTKAEESHECNWCGKEFTGCVNTLLEGSSNVYCSGQCIELGEFKLPVHKSGLDLNVLLKHLRG